MPSNWVRLNYLPSCFAFFIILFLLAESERTRSQLRARNDDLKHAKENLDLQSLELQKWASIQVNYDAQLQSLQEELQAAQMTNAELDEQKQENLMLKETIDRMRYEMDEMRNNIAGVASGGTVSAKGSVSRTLGMELGNRLKDMEWEDRDDDERVKELLEEESEEEDEDVIQTVITRTKRVSDLTFFPFRFVLIYVMSL